MTPTKREQAAWSSSARAWFTDITTIYELTPSEMLVAVEIARGVTRLDAIDAEMQGGPLTCENRFGETVTAPLAVEARMLGQSVAKLIGALRLPEADAAPARSKPGGTVAQLRMQPRGFYGPGKVG